MFVGVVLFLLLLHSSNTSSNYIFLWCYGVGRNVKHFVSTHISGSQIRHKYSDHAVVLKLYIPAVYRPIVELLSVCSIWPVFSGLGM